MKVLTDRYTNISTNPAVSLFLFGALTTAFLHWQIERSDFFGGRTGLPGFFAPITMAQAIKNEIQYHAGLVSYSESRRRGAYQKLTHCGRSNDDDLHTVAGLEAV